MTATYCLDGFARTIRELKPDSWRIALAKVPVQCPHGCKAGGCFAVCREYAATQYRITKRRQAAREAVR